MPFSDFHGNSEVVRRLREMIARDHLPHAVVLAGSRGSGKYTLALMLAQTLNCLNPSETDGLPDFCGVCANCTRIAQAGDLDARFAEAVEARENLREADKKETRILVQTHPDVLVIPPDPPQMMIKVDQVRRVIETIYYRPAEGREKVYIFTDSAFMKEAANSLLKMLEEPPEFATIFLLTENPGELLPTIRSVHDVHAGGFERRRDRKGSGEASSGLEAGAAGAGGAAVRWRSGAGPELRPRILYCGAPACPGPTEFGIARRGAQ